MSTEKLVVCNPRNRGVFVESELKTTRFAAVLREFMLRKRTNFCEFFVKKI